MDCVARLLLRVLIVPLGYLAAVIAGTAVILFGSWHLGQLVNSLDPDDQGFGFLGLMLAGPLLFMVLLVSMWLPSAIGVLLAEAFALRSWIFHAANGAVSAYIGWQFFGSIDNGPVPVNDMLSVIAAGLAGGFAYWAVAGWSAGFWKPVFRREATLRPPVPATPR